VNWFCTIPLFHNAALSAKAEKGKKEGEGYFRYSLKLMILLGYSSFADTLLPDRSDGEKLDSLTIDRRLFNFIRCIFSNPRERRDLDMVAMIGFTFSKQLSHYLTFSIFSRICQQPVTSNVNVDIIII